MLHWHPKITSNAKYFWTFKTKFAHHFTQNWFYWWKRPKCISIYFWWNFIFIWSLSFFGNFSALKKWTRNYENVNLISQNFVAFSEYTISCKKNLLVLISLWSVPGARSYLRTNARPYPSPNVQLIGKNAAPRLQIAPKLRPSPARRFLNFLIICLR